MRGRADASGANRSSNVTSPKRSWKNVADRPAAATARAQGGGAGAPPRAPAAVGSCNGRRDRPPAGDAAARGQRGIDHRDDGGVAVLLELAGDHRAEVGERRLRPIDGRHPVAWLPIADADEVAS